MYPSEWKDFLKCIPVNEWLFNGEYLDFFPTPAKQEQQEKQTALLRSYTAISLSLPTSLYGEGRSCKMEAADDLSLLLKYVTHGDCVWKGYQHHSLLQSLHYCILSTQLTTLSIYLMHASERKYNNPNWVYIMWPLHFVILQFYRTCEAL